MNPTTNKARLRITVRGAVQGVGFRPFVYRLAQELNIAGTVSNSPQGVVIEAEASRATLEGFLERLGAERPPRSSIHGMELSWLDPKGLSNFHIISSSTSGPRSALVLPDIAICDDCRADILDSANRRFFYPFTNCTNCGPRFSIIDSLPYDRANTSMRGFAMCPECHAEFDDPANRRFHAQPNACARCGPHLALWDNRGQLIRGSKGDAVRETRAILETVRERLLQAQIVALKGLGGFHLLVDARQPEAVDRLRVAKGREEKPFAVMYSDLEEVERDCHVCAAERRLLRSPEAPIVLLRARSRTSLAANVAPDNPWLGVMLPYTPLHVLLLKCCGFPLIATSANLSDEPICTDEHEAVERLGTIADLFVVHNRPIVRHVDDSIARVAAGRETLLRRARGYAPSPVLTTLLPDKSPSVLATGAHLKNTVAVSSGNRVFLSQHIGDLETEPAFKAFQRATEDLRKLHELEPLIIAADTHPDYLSSRYARQLAAASGSELRLIQHHEAHVWACMAENELAPPVLGVAWDGTGFGSDGTIWGGEFFLAEPGGMRRIGHLRPFRLPGGEQAVKEPRRSAIGLLAELAGNAETAFEMHPLNDVFSMSERRVIARMLQRGVNAPVTSSMGRLFDAVASLAGLRQVLRHEGQAAMQLEFAAEQAGGTEHYPPALRSGQGTLILDWEPMVRAILADVRAGLGVAGIAARFQNTLVEWVLAVAQATKQERVVLSGGCFQNVFLVETAVARLSAAGFRAYTHQRVPPNDGGIALGQAVGAALARSGVHEA